MTTIMKEYKKLEVIELIDTKTEDGCKAIYYRTKHEVLVIDFIDTETNEVWHRQMFNAENKINSDYAFSQIQ